MVKVPLHLIQISKRLLYSVPFASRTTEEWIATKSRFPLVADLITRVGSLHRRSSNSTYPALRTTTHHPTLSLLSPSLPSLVFSSSRSNLILVTKENSKPFSRSNMLQRHAACLMRSALPLCQSLDALTAIVRPRYPGAASS